MLKRKQKLVFLSLLGLGFLSIAAWAAGKNQLGFDNKSGEKAVVRIFAVDAKRRVAEDVVKLRKEYSATKEEAKVRQAEFRARYEAAGSAKQRQEIVEKCRNYVFEILTGRIFPAWYGTAWGYNGASRVPGKDQIACGTFVVYTLLDAGFKIPSFKRMAQQPSENIIKNLIGPSHIKRLSSAPMKRALKWVRSQGEGLFIVGLDIHVGFIINNGGKITFCHSSSYSPPLMVVNQDTMEKSPLTDSRYRVFGKMLDDQMMIKWLRRQAAVLSFRF